MPPKTPFRRAIDKGHASELSTTAKAVCEIRERVAAAPRYAKVRLKRQLEKAQTRYLECQGGGPTTGTCRDLGAPHEYVATMVERQLEDAIKEELGEAAVRRIRLKTHEIVKTAVGEAMAGAGCAPKESHAGAMPSATKKAASSKKYQSEAFCEGKWGWGHGAKWTQGKKSDPIAVGFSGRSTRTEKYQISPPQCKPKCRAFPVA